MTHDCPLCREDGGALIWRGARLRVIRADEVVFPPLPRGLERPCGRAFRPERPGASALHEDVVAQVEQALRQYLQPTKVNIAALGNMVSHLHRHVIARFDWDSHFPAPVCLPFGTALQRSKRPCRPGCPCWRQRCSPSWASWPRRVR